MDKIIPLELLKFDPENPRLPSNLKGIEDDTIIIDYLLRDEGLTDLMGSIAQTGYAKAEPLLIVPDQDKFIVVEGNRRLAALKLLSNPELAMVRKPTVYQIVSDARHKPNDIPVILYENRGEILDYLGYRHITGIKEWDSMAKAKYLKQLYSKHAEGAEDRIFIVLARMIGSKANYVARLLTALGLCDYANDRAYFGLAGVNEDTIDFSLVTTALSYTNLLNYIGLEDAEDITLGGLKEEACKDLFDWMFVRNEQRVTRLGESRGLKDLSKVVIVAEALSRFKSGTVTLEEAVQFTDEPNETFFSFILKSRDSLRNAKNCLEQISSAPEGVQDLLNEITNLTKTITGSLEERFTLSDSQEIEALMRKVDPETLKSILAIAQRRG